MYSIIHSTTFFKVTADTNASPQHSMMIRKEGEPADIILGKDDLQEYLFLEEALWEVEPYDAQSGSLKANHLNQRILHFLYEKIFLKTE